MVTASSSASDILFNHETNVAPLGLIAMRGTEELGKKIDSYLVEWARKGGYDVDTFLRMPTVFFRRWKGLDQVHHSRQRFVYFD